MSSYHLAWLAAAQIELGVVDDAAATVAQWKRRFPDATAEVILGYPLYLSHAVLGMHAAGRAK